jgi:hypothetical protein
MKFAIFAATLLALAPVAATAALKSSAMASGPSIVRGTVISYAGPALVVKDRSGKAVSITLTPDAQAATVTIIPIDAIKPGSYIGTAAEAGKDGVLRALEVHVFPEALRGTGDGHRAWDLTKKSSMTNGNVSTVAEQGKAKAKAKGRLLTVDYQGGTQQVLVPETVPIVAFAPAQLSQLAPGVPVFVIVQPMPGDKLVANRVTLGTNGVAPPM